MPGRSLDTVVQSDAQSCRDAARVLGDLHQGVHEVGSGLHKARSSSESVWSGNAGDAFRELVRTNAGDADQVAEFLNRTKIALEKFADAIDTVTRRIQQARSVAERGKLVVTPTTIEEAPLPSVELRSGGPGARLNEDYTPEEEAILQAYQDKVDAWNEAHNTVTSARADEDSAHDTLMSKLKMMDGFTSYLVPQGWAWAPVVTGAYSGSHMVSKALTEAASTYQARADGALAVLANPELTPADRQKVLSNQLHWAGKVNTSMNAAQSAQSVDAKIPGTAGLKAAAGFNIKGVGAAGAIITTAQTYQSIKDGVRPDKAITKATAQTATGAAVGMFMTGAAAAGYITGAVASGGTLLVGTALAAGVGYYVDQHYYD